MTGRDVPWAAILVKGQRELTRALARCRHHRELAERKHVDGRHSERSLGLKTRGRIVDEYYRDHALRQGRAGKGRLDPGRRDQMSGSRVLQRLHESAGPEETMALERGAAEQGGN